MTKQRPRRSGASRPATEVPGGINSAYPSRRAQAQCPRSHRTSSALHSPINVDRMADLRMRRQQRLGEDGFRAAESTAIQTVQRSMRDTLISPACMQSPRASREGPLTLRSGWSLQLVAGEVRRVIGRTR